MGTDARHFHFHFRVIAAAVSTLSIVGAVVACTVVSGTSELQGGQCRKCVDASADADAAPDAGARPLLACGAGSCDTRDTWCCLAPSGSSGCGDPCPTATAALGCRLPSDCPSGQRCCAFRSNFSGESELRFFSDCLPGCNSATDEVVCDPRRAPASACTGGAPCVPSEVASVSVCR